MTPTRNMITKVAKKPPTLTIPLAEPYARMGLKLRAKSNPMREPGPPTAITSSRTTTSHTGGWPGHASSTVHTTAMAMTMPSTRLLRRSG